MKIDFSLLPWPCAIADDGGTLLRTNALWRARFGSSIELERALPAAFELLQRQIQPNYSDESAPRTFDKIVRAPGELAPLSLRFARIQEGEARWLLAVGEAHQNETQADTGTNADADVPTNAPADRDLEERDLERELDGVALRIQARNWRAFFHEAGTGKALIGLQGETLEVNAALCRLTGYSEERLLDHMVESIRHPDDHALVRRHYQEIFDGGPPVSGIESRYLHQAGHYLTCLLSLTLIRDSRGRPLYFAAEVEDITSRRQAEAQLREQTRQLETSNLELMRSNAELERFAFVASHDLQEPLRKIRVFGDRLCTFVSDVSDKEHNADFLRYVDGMMRSAQRMQSLIESLLAYGRLQDRSTLFVPVDLNGLWAELCDEFEGALRESAGRVEFGELPVVNGNASRLNQLFANLLSNSLKFRGDTPPVVRVRVLTSDATGDVIAGDNADLLRIEVSDNGIGFEPNETEAVFNVFARLHGRNKYPGTGIGLAICRRVAREHGGDVRAFGTPGQGARFVVTLPKP